MKLNNYVHISIAKVLRIHLLFFTLMCFQTEPSRPQLLPTKSPCHFQKNDTLIGIAREIRYIRNIIMFGQGNNLRLK